MVQDWSDEQAYRDHILTRDGEHLDANVYAAELLRQRVNLDESRIDRLVCRTGREGSAERFGNKQA